MEDENDNVVTLARQRLESWDRYAKRWYVTHYVLGLAAIACTTLVAAKPALLPRDLVDLLAWLACAALATSTFLVPAQKARAYRGAWRHVRLSLAVERADAAEGRRAIAMAIERGWVHVSGGDVSEIDFLEPRKG